ncbi:MULTISPECIES: 23S rRNA (cytidine-2'-O)-methyltransferase TlyA [Campylobacter]|uniref:TlyA family RNA methyltransferase n=1 Tax=Campylobacter porcelli TaxID=1660073 RepID=A0ABU7M2I4_9BACT|nr:MULTISPECIES: TlyA family RNA methyltransferase [unclassified Campylobacter]MCR8695726.1 TlyA family RNA methyltransferase [Campylobacter sp. RM19073]MEE3743919.1 TlyA family RNA methyltransferase [Campylobacter sp. CX2-4855-23]
MRADLAVANSLNISRNQAAQLIYDGSVLVNSKPINKPSQEISVDDVIEAQTQIYVSRAALKLAGFLDEIKLDLSGKIALDIGSSTGGFVQILLEKGIGQITALDVGTMQLSPNLRDDSRVIVQENTDIREFVSVDKFDIITADVSFISLLHIITHIDRLALSDIILLFKPQFEVGKSAKRTKNGVVKDEKAINKAMVKFQSECLALGWKLIKKSESKIKGKEGNIELFYYFKK